MSEEQQQNLKDYPYEAVSLSNTVPSMAHNPTTMPRDSIIPPSSQIIQNNSFPLPPAAYPAYGEPGHASYPQYYGPVISNDSSTNTHRAPGPTFPGNRFNNAATVHPQGSAHGTAYGHTSFDIPFRGVAENLPAPPVKSSKGATQGLNDAAYNHAVPGISMANIYRDLSVRFINSPQTNIVMMRMESLPNNPGRSKVTIELEIVDN